MQASLWHSKNVGPIADYYFCYHVDPALALHYFPVFSVIAQGEKISRQTSQYVSSSLWRKKELPCFFLCESSPSRPNESTQCPVSSVSETQVSLTDTCQFGMGFWPMFPLMKQSPWQPVSRLSSECSQNLALSALS